MARTKWILTLVCVAIVVIILWRVFGSASGAGRHSGRGGDAPVPVTVVTANKKNVPIYLTNQGTVTPINSVNVQPQVDGQLLKLDFTEGKPVKKGQLLAQIDPRTLTAQLDQAIAKRAQDQTQLATAQANFDRSRNPKYREYVPQIDRITQKNTVQQYQAAVAADNASIKNIKVQLNFTRVTSPIAGVAGIRQVDPGNVVTTGTTIVTVTQMRPIDVIFSLAGKYLDEVRAAQAQAPLQVAVLDANGNAVEADGLLEVIGNHIDPQSASFQLKAKFPNGKKQLYPGEFANVRLKVSVDANALVVPTAAVQRGPDGEYVWLVTDRPPGGSSAMPAAKSGQGDHQQARRPDAKTSASYVTMQPVTTGGEAGDTGLIIASGLQAGDRVVTAGQFRLKQGSAIHPLQPGQVPAPPTTAQIKAAAKHRGRRGH
jgi:multidrug efflux system membrane fusion protein